MIVFIAWIVFAVISTAIGASKNRLAMGLVMGVLLGLGGVIVMLILARKPQLPSQIQDERPGYVAGLKDGE